MKSVPVQFLVDSGSTLTLISYGLPMKMCTDKELNLQNSEHNVLVCDILPEGILGQDFLLKYV